MSLYAWGLLLLATPALVIVSRPAWPWLRLGWRRFWAWYQTAYGSDSQWDDYWVRLAADLRRVRAMREQEQLLRRSRRR